MPLSSKEITRRTGRTYHFRTCAPAGAGYRSLTVQQLLRLPFYHPVPEEGLRTVLRALAAQLPSVNESDLSMCGVFNAETLD